MTIENFEYGKMTIDGVTYTSDLIIVNDQVKDGWERAAMHSIEASDITQVLVAKPEILVLGLGDSGHMSVPRTFKQALKKRDIKLISKVTADAVRTYNKQKSKGKNVAAAFHLFC